MKKLFAILLVLCCCSVFFACEKQCEHQYQEEITTAASCSTAGIKTFTCTLCKESYTEAIPALEHNYEEKVTKEASCSEKGVATFTCSLCNDSYTEDIDMVAHTFSDAVITKEATCKETQVRGRYREALQILFVLNYDVEIKVPTDFVGRDLFTGEKAELCAILNIHDSKGRRVGWTTVSKKLKESGYTLTERRYNSRRCVVISI